MKFKWQNTGGKKKCFTLNGLTFGMLAQTLVWVFIHIVYSTATQMCSCREVHKNAVHCPQYSCCDQSKCKISLQINEINLYQNEL